MSTTATPPLSVTPTPEPVVSSAVVPSAAPTPEPVVTPTSEPYATPTPWYEGGSRCAFGEAHLSLSNSPTVEERFGTSERSARVRLKDARVVPADVAIWANTGTIEFDLEVLEWLTGDGPSEFTAEVEIGSTCAYSDRKDREVALTVLSIGITRRWDRAGEAILFLGDLKTQPYSLGYLGQIDNFQPGGLDTSEPIRFWNLTWLPKVPNEDKYIVHTIFPPLEGFDYTVSLDEIRETTARISEELNLNDSEEYKACVRRKYEKQRNDRYLRTIHSNRTEDGRTRNSTASAPGIVQVGEFLPTRPPVVIKGPHAELFNVNSYETTDNFVKEGPDAELRWIHSPGSWHWNYLFTSTQSLSEGTYEIHIQYNHEAHALCGQRLITDKWFITVPLAESGDR
ncbi:MAG: hypothetical protein F4W93_14125 [Dehalococcoidia bacterium]|nr:hypothetical protein [Dehalococcoidia bacterium]